MNIRRAQFSDLKFMYDCRNSLSTREMMLSQNYIYYRDHKNWLKKNLNSKTCFIYIGLKKKTKIGVIIYKTNNLFLNADVSITIHENFRNKGLSARFLKKSIEKFKKDYIFNINLIAVIKNKNIKSLRIFKKNGFYTYSKKKDLVYLKKVQKINKEKKIGLIIQARQTSKRLPNKVLKKIKGHSIIEILLSRLIRSKEINLLIVAIPDNKKNDKLYRHLKNLYVEIYRGSEQNVLKRYYETAKFYNLKSIVRITSDCPLLNYKILDRGIKLYNKYRPAYLSNTLPRSTPRGFSIEIINFKALEESYFKAKKNYQKEHVNYYIIENSNFKKINFLYKNSMFSKKNFSVDTKTDYNRVSKVFNKFYPNFHFDLNDINKIKNISKL